jgi:hypothetical protein
MLVWAVVSGLVLALTATTGAQAAPAKKTYKIIPYVISDPALVKNPQRVVAEFAKHHNLDALGVTPATADGPSKLTRRAATLADPVSYVVDSSRYNGGKKPADPYNYITGDECETNADRASTDAGWIKNRYSYCQIHLVYMPAIECGIFPPSCRVVGNFLSSNTLVGHGKIGAAAVASTTRWAEFTLDVEILTRTGPFTGRGARLEAELECDGNYLDEDYPQTDGNACLPGFTEDNDKSLNQWMIDDDATLSLYSQASSPSASAGEQIGTGVFHVEYDFDLPWYIEFLDTESPEGGMRFDTAWYLNVANTDKLGSVFDRAVPGLSINETDPAVEGAARHIEDARTNPAATVPVKPDKVLPGATPGDPLHRLAGAKDPALRARATRNRTVSTNFCATAAMPPRPETGGPFDCDEYPMASTYEGAARWEFDGPQYQLDYSVRWVNRSQNQEAGRRIGRWYEVDRILDREAFFITTTDTGPVPVPDPNPEDPDPDDPGPIEP